MARPRFTVAALPVLVALGLATAAGPAEAATITVTNASDGNAGSLRWAIQDAELQPDHDTIKFDIPGAGAHKITLAADLPALTQPAMIKGYSQPGAVKATSTTPAEPAIEIDAGNAYRGLDLSGSRIEVNGLAIHSAEGQNVSVEGQDNVVAGNHIGTNRLGDEAIFTVTQHNVHVYGTGNVIGGPRDVDRNVISGALIEVALTTGKSEVANNRIGTNADGTTDQGYGWGVALYMGAGGSVVRDNLVSGLSIGMELVGDGNTVEGNRVGTNAAGTAAIPNGVGINVEGGDENTIGGLTAAEGNLISGNDYAGIQLEDGDQGGSEEVGPAVGNRVLGNLIGTDESSAVPLGNGSALGLRGIVITGSDANTIGGHEPGAGNVIAANTGDGVWISGTGNSVLGNAIGTNLDGALGLGNGGNGVHIYNGERNNVGDESGKSMNTIAYNGEDGVAIEGTAPGDPLVRTRATRSCATSSSSTAQATTTLASTSPSTGSPRTTATTSTAGPTTSSTTRSSPPSTRPRGPSAGRSTGSRTPTTGLSSTQARSATAPEAAKASATSAPSTSPPTPRAGCEAPRQPPPPPPPATTSP